MSIVLRARPIGVISFLSIFMCANASFVRTNLTSNEPAAGLTTDANLVNPWGLALSGEGPFWVANNGTSTSSLVDGNGIPQPPENPFVLKLFPESFAPTGLVYNEGSNFLITNNGISAPALFIFVGESGLISGWNPSVDAFSAVNVGDTTMAGAVIKGAAIATTADGHQRLFVTNFRSGRIEVYNEAFRHVTALHVGRVPNSFAPFGIENINGVLYVSFAKRDLKGEDDVPGPGNGYIVMMRPNGSIIKVLVPGGNLNSPWGMALAPAGFGEFGGALLVGNFGDGIINAYNFVTGAWLGTLSSDNGDPIVIDGLWALSFGNGVMSDANSLYFTSGPNDEEDGLFGRITFAP